jgi:hypothetical protein
MKLALPVLGLALSLSGCASVQMRNVDDGSRWWKHVEYLASDELMGRYTGSDGYMKAARYVAGKFEEAGLRPSGTQGYLQPVEFESRRLIADQSIVEIVRRGKVLPLKTPKAAVLGLGGNSGELVEAPLIFAGYGLTIPEANYDDYQGLVTEGAILVFFAGAPKSVPPLLASHYSSVEMVRNAIKKGIRGALVLANPRVFDLPWDTFVNSILQTGLQPSLPGMGDEWKGGPFAFVRADAIDLVLQGSGHTLRELSSLDREGKPLPHFALDAKLRIKAVFDVGKATSPNVVAILRGSDAQLQDEFVLISAHLDHIGPGVPVNGDNVYNGAMDNASGVAALLEVGRLLRSSGPTKRSVLFLACTGEEEGLKGSEFFAEKPTVNRSKIIAAINLDMYLPLFPLKIVRAYGLRESDLERHLQATANEMQIRIQDDPTPERNMFIRSDQYSFIKKGIPSLFLEFGYQPGSPEEKIANAWFEQRYHAPSDDSKQPVDKSAASKFNQFMAKVTRRIADAPKRPAWNSNSFFKRFAQ